MAVTKVIELYETLTRYGGGEVKGMQVQYATLYYDDGVLTDIKIGAPKKVAVLVDDQDGMDLVQTVHTPTAIAMQLTIDRQAAEIESLKAQLAALTKN